MTNMKVYQLLTFVGFLWITTGVLAAPDISIDDSNVPDVQYEISAVDCLQEAYVLFPKNIDKRMERFLRLYEERFNTTEWNVADDCVLLYLPTDYISVRLKVLDHGISEFVKLFSSNSSQPTPTTTTAVPHFY